jgi:CubicO group peptidase (beta-lactamase class C family)
MLRKLKLIGQLLLLQLTSKSQAIPFANIPFSNPLTTERDSIIHEQVKIFFSKTKAPGLIIGISQNGKREFYNYGVSDSASKRPFGSNTVFEIGSITKTFSANLLFHLQEEGLLDIGKPVTSFLPSLAGYDSVLNRIVLKDLASQQSGLPRLPSNLDKIKEYSLMQPYKYYNREHLYAYLSSLKNISPGKYGYSNLGFGLLSTIEENASGLTFESLLEKYIFRPLSMPASSSNRKKTMTDTATGYFYGKPAEYWEFDCLAGAGAIKSNAADMLSYLEAHYSIQDEKFSKIVQKITVPVGPAGPGMQVCYGWHTLEDLKHRAFWHNGGTYGFSTYAAFEPVSKTSIILAANCFSVNAALDKLAVDLLILLTGE